MVQNAQRERIAALAVDDARVPAAEARAWAAERVLEAAQTELARRMAALDQAEDSMHARELAADEREGAAGARDQAADDR